MSTPVSGVAYRVGRREGPSRCREDSVVGDGRELERVSWRRDVQHTRTLTHVHTCTDEYTRTYVHTCTRVHTNTHTDRYSQVHTYAQSLCRVIDERSGRRVGTRTHTRVCIYIYSIYNRGKVQKTCLRRTTSLLGKSGIKITRQSLQ